ncbi:alpha/beta hydrolase [Pseudomonas sp. PS02288]|uniref:alpha/beta fold hydrolase n=1 Tax=Pseudomonas sp. PS02288 TaxID=2991443 RepID=UPI00249ADA6D|nr:alpha/beta hydrolase [Pseudomonas sp. PS02288]
MHLHPWSLPVAEGFTLRGWHSEPSGKPLLHFLHGNGFCTRTYEPLLRRLSDDFDLWLGDFQGHGESDHGGTFVGWNRSAELAVQCFESGRGLFGEVPRLALGHSFGGVLTGLILAERPDLFQRAVLLDPVLFSPRMLMAMRFAALFGQYGRHQMARRAAARRNHWPDRPAVRANFEGRGIFKGWCEEALDAHIEHALRPAADGGVELKCRPSREAEVFSSSPQRLWPTLRQVRTPTRVIHGRDSYAFIAPSVARWCAASPSLSEQAVDGGHCFMQEHPEHTAVLVRGFLLEQSF